MGCCGDDEAVRLRKEEGVRESPFFSAIAGDSGGHLLAELAAAATLRKMAVGKNLDDVPHGTFVLVIEGELAITEPAPRRRSITSKVSPDVGETAVMAHRGKGDFFRTASMSGGGKASTMMGLSTIAASVRSIILLLSPDAIATALETGKKEGTTPRSSNFVSILQEMLKSVREPPPRTSRASHVRIPTRPRPTPCRVHRSNPLPHLSPHPAPRALPPLAGHRVADRASALLRAP